jgi:hypothetical protein
LSPRPFDLAEARAAHAYYDGRAVRLSGALGEVAGDLALGAVWIVTGPLLERSIVTSDLAAQATRAGRQVLVASTHRRSHDVGIAVCDAGGSARHLRVLGAGDCHKEIFVEPQYEAAWPALDLLVLEGPEELPAQRDGWVAACRRVARTRSTAVVVGAAAVDVASEEGEMIASDRMISVGAVEKADVTSTIEVRARLHAPRRTEVILGAGPGRIVAVAPPD